MIWYFLGGLIGLIFFKKKYNLSFWKAVWYGIVFALGLYFSYGTIVAVLSLGLGLEEYTETTLLGLVIYALLAFGSFKILKRLKNQVKEGYDQNIDKSYKDN